MGMLLSFAGSTPFSLNITPPTDLTVTKGTYTIGIIVSLVGTGFLIGFLQQVKLMFKPVRVVATIVFFVSMGMVFVAAFVLGNALLCLIMVIVEYLAYTW